MENNSKASSSNSTKNINIRYYFVTDQIERYKFSLEGCPTSDMIGYFMTKPSQGQAFKKFRDQLMGVTESQDPSPGNYKQYCEYKLSKQSHKSTRNAAPAYK